jgi:hypothetical protein
MGAASGEGTTHAPVSGGAARWVRRLWGWLVLVLVLTGCTTSPAAAPSGVVAAPPAAGIELSDTDPCTLLNIQQQRELGDIDVVQPVPAAAGNTACEYLQRQPRWSVTITVGTDHQQTNRPATGATRAPEHLNIEGFPAVRQELTDGCTVDVSINPGQSLAVRGEGPGLPAPACQTAAQGASLAVDTVKRRH